MPYGKNKMLRFFYRIPFFNGAPQWKYNEEFNHVDFIYLRRPMIMTGFMLKVLKQIKENNKKVKIIMEIPTYPYDDEILQFKFSKVLLWKDKYNRNKFKGVIDKIATVTDDVSIFNIPTLKISNGVEIDSINQKKFIQSKDGAIHLCAVAMFKEWHGYERILYAMSRYYKNGGERIINCHFVGDGTELIKYKQIVQKENLEEVVKFYGMLNGVELDKIYDLCDLSLGSFGFYKIGLEISCNLKSREALARGIPSINGSKVDVFMENPMRYHLELSNDSSDIDLQWIIDFHDEIYSNENGETIINNIRDYAKKTVNIEAGMKNILAFLKSE